VSITIYFPTPAIREHITGVTYRNQQDQFIYDLLNERLDTLQIKPGTDLIDYIDGNGRWNTERTHIYAKMQPNIQQYEKKLIKLDQGITKSLKSELIDNYLVLLVFISEQKEEAL